MSSAYASKFKKFHRSFFKLYHKFTKKKKKRISYKGKMYVILLIKINLVSIELHLRKEICKILYIYWILTFQKYITNISFYFFTKSVLVYRTEPLKKFYYLLSMVYDAFIDM